MSPASQPMNVTAKTTESKFTKIINISEEQQVQIFAKQMLAKRLFIGHFVERRYVEPLNSYRDIVYVCDSEDKFPQDLDMVKRRIQKVYPPHIVWTGITGPDMIGAPAGCCLWVKLSNLPFGYYWFQVKDVHFDESMEIHIRLKCLRATDRPDIGALNNLNTAPKINSPGEGITAEHQTEDKTPSFDFQNVLTSFKEINYYELILGWLSGVSLLCTRDNLRHLLSFLIVLVITAGTGFLKFVACLGEFTLGFMREISVFIQVCTPIFLGIIEFFWKCVAGIFTLIALVCRGTAPPPAHAFRQSFRPQGAPLALPPGGSRSPPFSHPKSRNTRPFM